MIYRPLSVLEEISEEEQNKIKAAFEHIEKNRFKDAEELLFAINNNSSSKAAKACVQYGFGILNIKRPEDQSYRGLNILDETINYFDRSVRLSEKPEAYLLLGEALYRKLDFILKKTKTAPDRNSKLIGLINRALFSFKNAKNAPEYNGTYKLVKELKKTKKNLQRQFDF